MPVFSERAIQLIADAKINEAIRQGEFENLPGMGKPFEFDEMGYDPNWWIRRKIELENLQKLAKEKRMACTKTNC